MQNKREWSFGSRRTLGFGNHLLAHETMLKSISVKIRGKRQEAVYGIILPTTQLERIGEQGKIWEHLFNKHCF